MVTRKNNKIPWIAGCLVVLTLTTLAIVAVEARQPAGRFGPPMGPRHGFGMGPGPFGMMPGLRDLDLSDTQREQIRAALKNHEAEFRALAERGRTAHQALQAAVTADTVDETGIRQASAAVAAVEADGAVLRARVHVEVFQLLTPEQQQRVRERRTKMQQR